MTAKPLAPRRAVEQESPHSSPEPAVTASKGKLVPLFVYGTLKRGMRLHEGWLGGQMFVGKAVVSGFTLLNLGTYPAMFHTGNDNDKVLGEYYLVEEKCFTNVSDMETAVGYQLATVAGKFSIRDASLPSEFHANAYIMSFHSGTVEWAERASEYQGKTYIHGDVVNR